MTCRMKWVTCYKLQCTRCPCRSPWHFPIGKKHQLAHHVLCAIFVKTFLLLRNKSSLISAKTRVENGLLIFKSNTIEEIVHILSNFCILTLGAGWLILITPPHKWYKMTLDHRDEQYNAWKLKLMYKIKNIERCQFFWMGIQMFFGNPNRNIWAYSVFQKSFSECPSPVICLSVSFWT